MSGIPVTLRATADAGYLFRAWAGAWLARGNCTGTAYRARYVISIFDFCWECLATRRGWLGTAR